MKVIFKFDKEYDELPHKSVLYNILDTLKKNRTMNKFAHKRFYVLFFAGIKNRSKAF